MKRAERCLTCRFAQSLGDEFTKTVAICRRNPPTARPTLFGTTSIWPVIHKDDWCGEWRSRSSASFDPTVKEQE